MSDKDAVLKFLEVFKVKKGLYGILILSREKNRQTTLDLELTGVEIEKIIDQLIVEDYSEGPLKEEWHGSKEMWVFGKNVKGKEVYIKITLGFPKSNAICISFHLAEHPMRYPLKTQK